MRAIILAAGRGSRLGTLTADRPKCLVEFAGKALLVRQIESLRAGGVRDITLVTGYCAGALSGIGSETIANPNWQSTGIVGSLSCAADRLATEPVVVSYSDIFYSAETVRRLIAAPGPVAVTTDPDWLALWSARFAHPFNDAEQFDLDADGRVTRIGGRANRSDPPKGQFMGLLRIEPDGWRRLEDVLKAMPAERAALVDTTTLLSEAIANGLVVHAVARRGPWGEVDHPSDVSLYERLYPELKT